MIGRYKRIDKQKKVISRQGKVSKKQTKKNSS